MGVLIFILFVGFLEQSYSMDQVDSKLSQEKKIVSREHNLFYKNQLPKANRVSVGKKLTLVNSSSKCLDVEGINSTEDGTNVGIWDCNEVSETWVYNESTGKITLGYDSSKCLAYEWYLEEANVFITNCNYERTTWMMSTPYGGKICTGWKNNLCMDVNGDGLYAPNGYNVALRDTTSGIGAITEDIRVREDFWSFNSYEPRLNGEGNTQWNLTLYGRNDYANTSRKIDIAIRGVENFFYYHWSYMPHYIKKHALNYKPNIRVRKLNWDLEVANGAPEVSWFNAHTGLGDFKRWLKSTYTQGELDMNVFVQWGGFNDNFLGSADTNSNYVNAYNGTKKFGIAGLKRAKSVLSHEIGHTFAYVDHPKVTCYLPGVGRRYSIMGFKIDAPSSVWHGPVPCQDQSRVLGVFYQLAFANYISHWKESFLAGDISYNANQNAFILDTVETDFVNLMANNGKAFLFLTSSAAGLRSTKQQPWLKVASGFNGGFYGLFTVFTNSLGQYELVPDDPIAFRFFAYRKTQTGSVPAFFGYHTEK